MRLWRLWRLGLSLADVVASADKVDPVSLRRLCLPRLMLSRRVRFTNRFTEQTAELRNPEPSPSFAARHPWGAASYPSSPSDCDWAPSSRTSGAAGRLAVVPASLVCCRSWLLAAGRGRCCTWGCTVYRISSSGCDCPDRFKLDRRCWSVFPGRCCMAVNCNPNCNRDPTGPCDRPHRAGDGPRPVRAGSGLALVFWPECPQVSRIKRDFACTLTRHLSPVLVGLRSQSRLRLEGRARTLSGPRPRRGWRGCSHGRGRRR